MAFRKNACSRLAAGRFYSIFQESSEQFFEAGGFGPASKDHLAALTSFRCSFEVDMARRRGACRCMHCISFSIHGKPTLSGAMPIEAAFLLYVYGLDMYVQAKGRRNDASLCREQQQAGTRLQQSLSADWGMTEEAAPRPSVSLALRSGSQDEVEVGRNPMDDPALVSLHVPAGFSTSRVVYMTYGAALPRWSSRTKTEWKKDWASALTTLQRVDMKSSFSSM